ncbi:hypothetical protein ACFWBC_14420 [Streptomyces sp. NPDC059985]|uniref:phosphorylase family protein n=1 Tax=Streptomyces sp. NPDC059985 TaxID=3347025 RepID=UPI003673C803
MPDAPTGDRPDWGTAFRSIADDWLFADVDGPLPAEAVLPLENPDLYDSGVWDKHLKIEERYRTVSIGVYAGRRIAVLNAKLGAPAAAMAIQAAAGRGVRSLVGVGYCGAVADDLRCGDLLVPTGAVSADGTSAALCPGRYPAVADHQLVRALHDTAPGTLRDGLVHTLDAVYTQDSALVEECRRTGVSGIDMETAAVLTAARLSGMRAATLLVASDHPGLGLPTDGALIGAGFDRAMGLALEALTAGGAR